MERDERRGRVSREREHGHIASLVRRRDGREGCGLPRLDTHPAEVDGAVEVALDDGLEEVARAHAGPAGREHEVGVREPPAERADVFVEAR